ncbi:MAG: SPOR domain-containing protein [Steroidobacteraceae bacterium]
MENRVKERLTGAIILVAVMVILVPEMFSGQHSAQGSLATAPRPASEGPPLRSYTMNLDADGNARPGSPATAANSAPTLPPMVAAVKPVLTATLPPVATPAPAPAPAPAVRAPNETAGGWYVQVGSFSKADNAQRYAQEISRKGFVAHVDSGGKLLRVRVGPVADRDAALDLKAQLAAKGYKGALTSQ